MFKCFWTIFSLGAPGKSQQAMKAYKWDFLFKLDLFLLIKYTYINKEQHTMEKSFIYFLLLFYFICHTIITKNIGKEEKKKWRGDLTEAIGAYERLGLLELWARAVSHQLQVNREYEEKVDFRTNSSYKWFIEYSVNLLFDLIIAWGKELMVLNAGYWPD